MAILGQDSSLRCDTFCRFPTLIFYPPWLLRITLVRNISSYDRSYTYKISDAMYHHRSILTRRSSTIRWYTSLHYSLHIPLSPGPFQQLCNDDPILPNPYNGVFHLRSHQTLAVLKAQEHMMWKDDGRGIAQDQELYIYM